MENLRIEIFTMKLNFNLDEISAHVEEKSTTRSTVITSEFIDSGALRLLGRLPFTSVDEFTCSATSESVSSLLNVPKVRLSGNSLLFQKISSFIMTG